MYCREYYELEQLFAEPFYTVWRLECTRILSEEKKPTPSANIPLLSYRKSETMHVPTALQPRRKAF